MRLIAAACACLFVFLTPVNAQTFSDNYPQVEGWFGNVVAPQVVRAGRKGSVSLSGVVAPLAAKAREIVVACGSRVVSGVRHTRVRGSGRLSLHASGRAVDLQGNPTCIYAHLRGWPGGVSTDYHSAPGGKHVHVSYSPNGREWGARFAHYKGGKRKARKAYAAAR